MKQINLLMWAALVVLLCSTVPALGQPANSCPALETFDGQAENDMFGYSVSGAGDVDGDGVPDVIVAATNIGRVYIYSGAEPRSLLVTLEGSTANSFGSSVSGAGDFNHDGYDDVIVGARGYDGAAYVFYGRDRQNFPQTISSANADITIIGESGATANAHFGHSVSDAGDVNGDGFDDIIVSANYYSVGPGTYNGRAYVFFGGPVQLPTILAAQADVFFTGGDEAYLGFSVSGAGDFDGDTHNDVIVGAPVADANGLYRAGFAKIYTNLGDVANIQTYTILGTEVNQYLGYSVSGVGDQNGVGGDDVIVGELNSTNRGRGCIYFLPLPQPSDPEILWELSGEDLGASTSIKFMSGAGDVDGDGTPDLIVGGSGGTTPMGTVGRAWVFSGGLTGELLWTLGLGDIQVGDMFGGRSISAIGDVNGDDLDDVIVGASEYDNATGANAGRAYIYGSACPTPGFEWDRNLQTPNPGPRIGHAMVYDPNGPVVLFGGNAQGTVLSDQWEWDGSIWADVTPQPPALRPAARHEHAMAYHQGLGVLLFGGEDDQGWFHGDTWVLRGQDWEDLQIAGPTPRGNHAMAYDASQNETILYGGLDDQVPGDRLTWIFDGASWSSENPPDPRPGSLSGHAMAYDPLREVVVLFGGIDWTGTGISNETWEWNGKTRDWNLAATSGPAARSSHSLVYDNYRGTVVLFGGNGSSSNLDDMWEWNGTTWNRIISSPQAAAGPSARAYHAAAYDVPNRQMVVFGGWDGTILDQTWVYPRESFTRLFKLTGNLSNGNSWSWAIRDNEPNPDIQVFDDSVPGVLPVNEPLARIASDFVANINASGCNGVRAVALLPPGSNLDPAPFTVTIASGASFHFYVGPQNNPMNCEIFSDPISVGGGTGCWFNPEILGIDLTVTDCNTNLIDDAIDILSDFSRDLDYNGVPDECDPPGCANRGDIDHRDGEVNISDLTYLVDYFFRDGDAPLWEEEADVNGDGQIDIADLTDLVAYLFQGGEAPIPCGSTRSGAASKLRGDVSMHIFYENGTTTISLESPGDVRGVQIELLGSDELKPAKLVENELELLFRQSGNSARIGILDLDGGGIIKAGRQQLVQMEGRFEVISAIVSDMNHNSVDVNINVGKQGALPNAYTLSQNYPNPFNPMTRISFALPVAGDARIDVFNVLGRRVVTLADRYYEAGFHSVEWDAGTTASGIYFYRLTTREFVESKKMLLLK